MALGNLHRIQKELSEMISISDKFRDIKVDESDRLVWSGLIYPINPPYNRGCFRIKITFPTEYPFKPPSLQFLTQIYHPNIDEKGLVCLNIINPEFWKPATKVVHIIEALVRLIENPEPDHPLRTNLAELFIKDKKKFLKNAEDFTLKNSENRNDV